VVQRVKKGGKYLGMTNIRTEKRNIRTAGKKSSIVTLERGINITSISRKTKGLGTVYALPKQNSLRNVLITHRFEGFAKSKMLPGRSTLLP